MWFYNFLFHTRLCDDFTMNTKCRERFQAWEDGNRSHQTFHWCLFLLCFPGAGRFHDGAVDQRSGHMVRYYTDVSSIETDAGWSVGGYSDRFEKKFGKKTDRFNSRGKKTATEWSYAPSRKYVEESLFNALAGLFSETDTHSVVSMYNGLNQQATLLMDQSPCRKGRNIVQTT